MAAQPNRAPDDGAAPCSMADAARPLGLLEFDARSRVQDWVQSLSPRYDFLEATSRVASLELSRQWDAIHSKDIQGTLPTDDNIESHNGPTACVGTLRKLKPSDVVRQCASDLGL